MKKRGKIVFISAHNWEAKRLGGFHKFAQGACKEGYDVVFFTFPRPYYSYFMHQEMFNRKAVKTLKKGINYNVEGSSLLNITLPTLKFPNAAGKILSDKMMNALESFSFYGFKRFAKKYFNKTDFFVFESCDGIIFVDIIKKMFPEAKIIYRPSDPMMYDSAPTRYIKNETNIMKNADITIIVNDICENLYKSKLADFYLLNTTILPNGVEIEPFLQNHEKPELLKKENTILYIGAWDIEWPLIFKAAEETPDYNYIIVNPNTPAKQNLEKAAEYKNIFFVPGIKPSEVPAWITNCTVFMVPYPTNFYTERPMGITAKYYQAMAAHKPIVSYFNNPSIAETGAVMTFTYDDFISEIKKAVTEKTRKYNIKLEDITWSKIQKKFMKLINF